MNAAYPFLTGRDLTNSAKQAAARGEGTGTQGPGSIRKIGRGKVPQSVPQGPSAPARSSSFFRFSKKAKREHVFRNGSLIFFRYGFRWDCY